MISPEQKILIIILSYLIGSISTSTIICRIKNVDIKKIGSGNAGATNTVRALGKKYGMIVLLLDILKGALPVMIATYLSPNLLTLPICCAFAVVTGHVFPIYFAFKGGKGAGTLIGIISVLFPSSIIYALLSWIITLVFTGYVGLGTMIASIVLVISAYYLNTSIIYFYFSVLMSLFIIFTHRSNIKRMIQGKENRFKRIMLFK